MDIVVAVDIANLAWFYMPDESLIGELEFPESPDEILDDDYGPDNEDEDEEDD